MRIYPTVVLEGTRLGMWYRQGLYHPPGVEESVPLCAGLLEYLEGQGIRVIRLGLHASRSLEERLLAGAYHPAFRELCEGELLLRRFFAAAEGHSPGPVRIALNPRDRSRFTGPHRQNLVRLQNEGWSPVLVMDESVPPGSLRVMPQGF